MRLTLILPLRGLVDAQCRRYLLDLARQLGMLLGQLLGELTLMERHAWRAGSPPFAA